jgi:riboflavin synthase
MMFTGLIETIGTIKETRKVSGSLHLAIARGDTPFTVKRGDSVSVHGACLTVESIQGDTIGFTAVAETIRRTTLYTAQRGTRVNLERSCTPQSRLDGHIVLGHVDATGSVVDTKTVGESRVLTIRFPDSLAPFIAEKGSVAVNGISLTVVDCTRSQFRISIIPYTYNNTTMKYTHNGESVNIEVDIIARYVGRMFSCSKQTHSREKDDAGHLLETMERLGF